MKSMIVVILIVLLAFVAGTGKVLATGIEKSTAKVLHFLNSPPDKDSWNQVEQMGELAAFVTANSPVNSCSWWIKRIWIIIGEGERIKRGSWQETAFGLGVLKTFGT